MAKITNVKGRQIFDSRGNPTVEAEVFLENGISASSISPSGASTGAFEAYELRDKDLKKFLGKSVNKAVENINKKICTQLKNLSANNQEQIDKVLLELDGSENKTNLGANATLAVSLAYAKCSAIENQISLFKNLSKSYSLPIPLMNIINGGAHADNDLNIQEFMIRPDSAINFMDAMEKGFLVIQNLKKLLKAKKMLTNVGDEGGFAPSIDTNEQALEFIVSAIEQSNLKPGVDVAICIDVAANELINQEGLYSIESKNFETVENVIKTFKVKENKPESFTYNGALEWGAIRTKYFTLAFLPKDPNSIRKTIVSGLKQDSSEVYNLSMVSSASEKAVFHMYLGPLEYDRIKEVGQGLEGIMDFGWSPVRPISKAVLLTLTKMHEYIPNYGYILVLFSLLIKIVVYPLTKKAYQSTTAMQKIQPELLAIREKYKNNPQKLNQAQMKIYKKRGVNPLGGCLPMLIQMPLLYSLFVVFRTTIELRSEPFVLWIQDLSAPDYVFELPFHIPIYGSQVAVLPIFMVVSMFLQQKMMTGGTMQQPQQKTMQYIMIPVFFLIFNGFPSGLNLYYTLFNILTILQQKFITDKN
mgnify:CR=1 FL=1